MNQSSFKGKMAKTKKTKAMKKKKVMPKKKVGKKIVAREKEPEYMVQINDPKNVRKNLLESLREIIIFMQSYEKFKKIQEEKVATFNALKADIKALGGLLENKLKKHFPKGKLHALPTQKEIPPEKEEREEKPVEEAVSPEPTSKAERPLPSSELDELESQLKEIEGQLKGI